MAKEKTTTEKLQEMLREQQEKDSDRTVSDDGRVVINHPNNRGRVVGTVKGEDFTW